MQKAFDTLRILRDPGGMIQSFRDDPETAADFFRFYVVTKLNE